VRSNVRFALNHIAVPALDSRGLIDLAARLGCAGVELRNDLAEKKLASRDFFDGEGPAAIGDYARSKGVRLVGLSEVYGFNRWSETIFDKVRLLISQAKESGAETISLIPSNDGMHEPDDKRLSDLRNVLALIRSMLDEADLVALVEPLGFATSSLRTKREAIDAIRAIGGEGRFRLVHDTFHHFIAGETEFFPEWTGIVHVSGIVDPSLQRGDMMDAHRVLVDEHDRLQNVEQITALRSLGYDGVYSYEPFAASVHSDHKIEDSLRASMLHINQRLCEDDRS